MRFLFTDQERADVFGLLNFIHPKLTQHRRIVQFIKGLKRQFGPSQGETHISLGEAQLLDKMLQTALDGTPKQELKLSYESVREKLQRKIPASVDPREPEPGPNDI